MPRIGKELLDTVFYLYPTREAAVSGQAMGRAGFVVAKPSAAAPHRTYLFS